VSIAGHGVKGLCPRCGAPLKRVRVLYGYPTPEAEERAGRGEVVLGGCVIGYGEPKWACAACREPLWSRPSAVRDDVPDFRLVETGELARDHREKT